MKRLGLALVSIAALGLTACQGHSPTGPSEAPAVAAVNGVLNDDSEDSYVKARLTANPSTISAGQTLGTELYAIQVLNNGAAPARLVTTDIFVDGAQADTARVDEIDPGEMTTVRITLAA